ncbi:type II toxin-antitoxin system PemK/MazF family toxin [Microcoleus sp. herbarium14]|uniref:type II toxin-antitoxin system PemK/MazF family toxin n=1 Tax=Microcoleus sp. herbarium14 TaxID=3055439 RepID=UPI002FCEFA3C
MRVSASVSKTVRSIVTTKIRRALLPSHVFVPSGVGGLNQDSVILCEQIRVIDKSRVIRIIGHLDDNYMDVLAVALRAILGV